MWNNKKAVEKQPEPKKEDKTIDVDLKQEVGYLDEDFGQPVPDDLVNRQFKKAPKRK